MRLLTFTLFLLISLFSSNANLLKDNFLKLDNKINITNGLAHNGVTSVLKDSRGYLWIATYDGLSCYNGFSTSTYKNSINSKLFQTNRIRSLSEDKNGNIWLGTDNGVTIFEYNNAKFKQLYSKQRRNETQELIIRKIFCNSKFSICFSEKDGIYIFNFHGKLLSHHNYNFKCTFQDVQKLDDNKYIIATNIGLLLYDNLSGKIYHVLKDVNSNITSLFLLDKSTLLISDNKAIYEVKIKTINSSISFELSSVPLLKENLITSMYGDNKKGLWISTTNNGFIYVNDKYSIEKSKKIRYIADSRINGFLQDNNEGMWVLTFDDGLLHFMFNKDVFREFDIEQIKMPKLISYSKNKILIYSSTKNTFIYDLDKLKVEEAPKSFIFSNIGYSLLINTKENIYWKFDYNEIRRIINGKDFKVKLPLGKVLPKERYSCGVEDFMGNLWIGYLNNLYRLSLDKKGEVIDVESVYDNKFFKNNGINKIRVIYSDRFSKSLWIGTDVQGLFKIDLNKKQKLRDMKISQFTHSEKDPESLSSNFVSSIIRTPDKTLWIGTEQGGLCKCINDKGNVIFKTYSESNSLSNNVVKSLSYDKLGRLWVATNIGLNLYNKKDDSFYVFRTDDGLPFEDFWYSCMSMQNGKIILSNVNTLCSFNPLKLPQKETLPKIYFSNFKIYDKKVGIGDEFNGRVIFTHTLNNGDCINLNYDENVFSLKIDAIYQNKSTNHKIYYLLEGISKEWMKMPAKRQMISFDGLTPGNYKLKVKASDSSGNFTKEQVLNIIISPPFWETIYAYILYFLMICGIVFIVIKFFMRLQRLKHKLMIEDIEKENLKLLNAEKQRFFSNISHELKTPLTLILAPLASLMERFSLDIETSAKLRMIKRQSRKMQQLVEFAHDIEKDDYGVMKTNFTKFSINDFLNEITDDFSFMAEYEKKEFVVTSPDKNIFVSADKDMIEKILNNILNNAFKHTRTEDTISIIYKREENTNNLVFIISDTGYGISDEDLPHIFERFYQAGNNKIGGAGIGLTFTKNLIDIHKGKITVKSELGRGTSFQVSLPIIVEELPYNENEVIKEEKIPMVIDNLNTSNLKVNPNFFSSYVYIVEDDPEMRFMLTDIVKPFFKYKAFSNGRECLDEMTNQWPDLILSDVMMPEVDGIELCNTIKSDIKTSHIPIILLTALSTIDDKIQGLKSGADSYINKPFYAQHVITRIENLLEGRKQLRERFQVGIPLSFGNKDKLLEKDNEFLGKLYELFSKNLSNENIDIDSFALELGVNRSMFYQKIKLLTNDSPYELLKKYRLKRAAEMLEKNEMNVNEVCELTGFKSRTHFGRLFKEMYNVSPGKYSSTLTNEDKK